MDALLSLVADVSAQPDHYAVLVVAAAVLLVAVCAWWAYRAHAAEHKAADLLLKIGGPEGRLGLRYDDLRNVNLGYGVLDRDTRYWVTAHDRNGRRLGQSVMLRTRSKKQGFDAGHVELNERDLERIGIRSDAEGDWPVGVRLKARSVSALGPGFWWNNSDPSTKLTVRLTTIVLGLQELGIPLVKWMFTLVPTRFWLSIWKIVGGG